MDWKSCLFDENGNQVATLQCIPIIFKNVLEFLLIFAGVTAVIIIMISGIRFLTSGGDPKQVEGARNTMTYAIAGLVIILLSFFIINIIADLTGAGCIKSFGFDTCK